MKNINVLVDDETHRMARIKADENGTSIEAMVREFLTGLTKQEPPGRLTQEDGQEILRKVAQDLRDRDAGLDSSENLPRDAVYDRNALR